MDVDKDIEWFLSLCNSKIWLLKHKLKLSELLLYEEFDQTYTNDVMVVWTVLVVAYN